MTSLIVTCKVVVPWGGGGGRRRREGGGGGRGGGEEEGEGEGEESTTVHHTHTLTHRLLGPRRRLVLALAELKKKNSKVERGGQERVEQEMGRGGRVETHHRPKLLKQPSTELVAAYHQVSVMRCVCVCVCV